MLLALHECSLQHVNVMFVYHQILTRFAYIKELSPKRRRRVSAKILLFHQLENELNVLCDLFHMLQFFYRENLKGPSFVKVFLLFETLMARCTSVRHCKHVMGSSPVLAIFHTYCHSICKLTYGSWANPKINHFKFPNMREHFQFPNHLLNGCLRQANILTAGDKKEHEIR